MLPVERPKEAHPELHSHPSKLYFLFLQTRGVPDQGFQNPAGTGFPAEMDKIRPDFSTLV